MVAVVHDIVIEQGATFVMRLRWMETPTVPMDLEDFVGRMQVRPGFKSEELWADLTTEDGHITLDPATGRIVVTQSAVETALIPGFGQGVYDLELERIDGFVKRLIQGKAFVRPEVTR